ncbi:ninja-family protein AFP3 [Senna tora]|uniref:Ninja-family protein n=1 Tax=Senna tora TaxID=362788 RepID=A0A834TTN0_9FABA|nr:ninja-family protein AFP3 [Senna tora]
MGEANEGRRRSSKAMENLSLQMEKYPKDLLQRFMCCSAKQSQYTEAREEESEEIELNLGLSLGGRFGVDKSVKSTKLMRSSSVVGTMPLVREDVRSSTTPPAPAPYPTTAMTTLMRTSSLPTETEEQWRKRKELQTLRRLEAKRRRSEKQRSSKSAERESSAAAGAEEERRETVNSTASPPPSFGLPSWPASIGTNTTTTRQVVLGDMLAKGNKVGFQGNPFGQPSSQGSTDSQGGGSSSGMSELESKPFQGTSSFGETRSPASNHLSQQDRSNQDSKGSSGTTKPTENVVIRTSRAEAPENPPKKSDTAGQNRRREIGTNSVEDMPCVFAKGDGPNGRRIDGILYRYGKGEEVRIMCVCHGNFLSPAEFVKHAGGGDVAHPLRHIVVNPSPTPFL